MIPAGKETATMDCCAHEGPGGGDATFDIKKPG
jgi:hypothetical protein